MVGEISTTVKNQVVFDIVSGGMDQREVHLKEGISLDSVNKIWKEFCNEVTRRGIDETLESRNMLDARYIASVAREMKKFHVTPRDCNRAIPIVAVCHELNVDPQDIRGLIESAVKLGSPEFPRTEYAGALARIHQREKQSGLNINELDGAHRATVERVQSLMVEEKRLSPIVHDQQQHSNQLTQELRTKSERVTGLDALLATEGLTRERLATYVEDRRISETLGFKLQDTQTARAVLTSFRQMSYDPNQIIQALRQVGNLQTIFSSLETAITVKKNEIRDLDQQRDHKTKQIQNLKLQDETAQEKHDACIRKLGEDRKAAEDQVARVRSEGEKTMAEITKSVTDALTSAMTTLQELEEFKASREKFKGWGISI